MGESILTKLESHITLSGRDGFAPQYCFMLGWPTEDDPRTNLPDFIAEESKLDCWCNAINYAGGDSWYEAAKRYKPGRIVTVTVENINSDCIDVRLPNQILGEVYLSAPIDDLRIGQQRTARVVINNPFQKWLVLQLRSAVRIGYLSSDCMSGLLRQVESNVPEIKLRSYRVNDVVLEDVVLSELGEDAFVSLAHIWQLLVLQGNGQATGVLQVAEKSNNFFVKDSMNQIWSVRLMWVSEDYDGIDCGWEILALPYNSKRFMEQGSMFFAREHIL